MVKCDEEYLCFRYYNDNGDHEFINKPTYDEAAKIIYDLMRCPEFRYDSTILSSLYTAVRKLQGFSDKDIQRMRV